MQCKLLRKGHSLEYFTLLGTILKMITILLSILNGLLDFFLKKTEVTAIIYASKVNQFHYGPGVAQRFPGS